MTQDCGEFVPLQILHKKKKKIEEGQSEIKVLIEKALIVQRCNIFLSSEYLHMYTKKAIIYYFKLYYQSEKWMVELKVETGN